MSSPRQIRNFLFILLAILSAHSTFSASHSTSADHDPEMDVGEIRPNHSMGVIPTAPPAPVPGEAVSDRESVLSFHDSDDDTLRDLTKEAHELGFSTDAEVKKSIRGKRHQHKLEIERQKIMERERRRAAFLAKIAEPLKPTPAAGGAGASSSPPLDLDKTKKGAVSRATISATTDLAEVSVERLAWMATGLNRRAQNILGIINAIKTVDRPERAVFAEKLKILVSKYGFMHEGLSVFMEVSKELTPINRYALMNDLELLVDSGFALTPNNIRALAKHVGKSKEFMLETLERLRSLRGIKKEDRWHGDIQDIIDVELLVESSTTEMSEIIESTYKVAGPFLLANDKKYSLFPYTLRMFANTKRENRKTLEEMILQRLETDMYNILGRAQATTGDTSHLVIEDEFYRILNEVSVALLSHHK